MSLEQQIERVATGLETLARILSSEMGARPPSLETLPQDHPAVVFAALGKIVAPPAPAKITKASAPPTSPPPAAACATEAIPDEVVKDLTRDLLKFHGRDVTVGLLGSVGATKATEIAQEHRAQYVADAKEMLKK